VSTDYRPSPFALRSSVSQFEIRNPQSNNCLLPDAFCRLATAYCRLPLPLP